MKYLFLVSMLCVSLMGNAFLIMTWIPENETQEQIEKEPQEEKVYFQEKIFGEDVVLKDYSGVRFTLEPEGKNIIQNAREFHSSPAIIKWEAYNEAMCAWYVFGLSEIFWDKTAPYIIGMMEQNSKTPADAWQLPYSYEYVGGKVLIDFTGDFSLISKNYWEVVDVEKLKEFFYTAFSEKALLGDIWFLFKDTEYIEDLVWFWNANSHITKNVWVSEFDLTLRSPEWKTHSEIFCEATQCSEEVLPKLTNILSHYYWELWGKQIVWNAGDFYFLWKENDIWKKVVFQDLDILKYKDITLMHFYTGAQVDSLLAMTLKGEFFPINVIQINPRMIEKM